MLLKSASKSRSDEVTWRSAVLLVELPSAALYTSRTELYIGEVTVTV